VTLGIRATPKRGPRPLGGREPPLYRAIYVPAKPSHKSRGILAKRHPHRGDITDYHSGKRRPLGKTADKISAKGKPTFVKEALFTER